MKQIKLSSKTKSYLYVLFGIMLIASAGMKIVEMNYAAYVGAVGAVSLIIVRISTLSSSKNVRVRRLQAILALSSLLMLATPYLMYIDHNAWALTLFLAAAFDLLVSYRMPSEK